MMHKTQDTRHKRVKLLIIFLLLVSLVGCDAFVKKFTRKKKKDQIPQEELVVEPQEYAPPQISKEEVYRQYFLFWRSWLDEFTNSLDRKDNYKKQLDCIDEALSNLEEMRKLLKPEKQAKLQQYIGQLKQLQTVISSDIYSDFNDLHRQKADIIKRGIIRDYSYSKIKDYLI